jgi:hypothetical protein
VRSLTSRALNATAIRVTWNRPEVNADCVVQYIVYYTDLTAKSSKPLRWGELWKDVSVDVTGLQVGWRGLSGSGWLLQTALMLRNAAHGMPIGALLVAQLGVCRCARAGAAPARLPVARAGCIGPSGGDIACSMQAVRVPARLTPPCRAPCCAVQPARTYRFDVTAASSTAESAPRSTTATTQGATAVPLPAPENPNPPIQVMPL